MLTQKRQKRQKRTRSDFVADENHSTQETGLTPNQRQKIRQIVCPDDPTAKMSDAQGAKPETNVSIFNSPGVTVALGPNKIQYMVHKQVLARAEAGQFFNKVFTNGFKEECTQYLELPEDDSGAFSGFVEWLYSTSIGSTAPNELVSERDAPHLLRLYIFAHKYMINDLQDAIMSKMYDRMQQRKWRHMGFDRDALAQFMAAVPSSHMHRLLARCFIDDALRETASTDAQHLQPDSVMEGLPDDFVRLTTREMFNIKLRHPPAENEVEGLKSEYLLRRATDQAGTDSSAEARFSWPITDDPRRFDSDSDWSAF